MKDLLPPQKYAEQVLGNAATVDQLEKLFELHAAAHPVVTHDVVAEVEIRRRRGDRRSRARGEIWHNLKRCKVELWSSNPHGPGGPVSTLATGVAICSPDDQWQKRRGVEIAFGRALEQLRLSIEGPKKRKPPKASELSTARILEALARHVEGAGEGIVALSYRPGKGWLVRAEFGREAEGSPMVGGAAYGSGEHLREALLPAATDCRIVAKEEPVVDG